MAKVIPSESETCTCGHGGEQHVGFWGRCEVDGCRCTALEPEILGHPGW